MVRISRSAAVPAAQPQAPARASRLRRSPAPNVHNEAAARQKAEIEKELDLKLKLIAENDEAIDAAVASNELLHKRVFELLKAGDMKGFTDGRYEVTRVIPMGRATTTVRVADYKKKVKPEEFEASINIPVGEAKKYLSEIELKTVVDTTPGKAGEETLKIERIVVKTKKTKA